MTQNQEILVNDLCEKGWSNQKGYFKKDFLLNLVSDLESKSLVQAGIGSGKDKKLEIRGDKIYWLSNDEQEDSIKNYFSNMNNLKDYLNRELYLGLKEYTGHYAIYPKGAFYKKHLDNIKNSNNRVVTFITYLNEDWKHESGGQLVIYLDGNRVEIEPEMGDIVCFLSDKIEHEVLEAKTNRSAITGWFIK